MIYYIPNKLTQIVSNKKQNTVDILANLSKKRNDLIDWHCVYKRKKTQLY